VSFTYPLPTARYGFCGGFSAYVQFAAGLGLAAAIVIATINPSWAQKAGGGKRTARVEIAEVKNPNSVEFHRGSGAGNCWPCGLSDRGDECNNTAW
jgi:hypothetical protein